MEIDLMALRQLIQEDRAVVVEQTVIATLEQFGLVKDQVTESKAIAMYGEANLKRWKELGLIQGNKIGPAPNSPIYYSRKRCIELRKTDPARRHLYILDKEAKHN